MMIEAGALPPLPNGERVTAAQPRSGEGACVAKRLTGTTEKARRLRRDETEAEFRLWGELRARRLNGHKFARQVPLGRYVVDFLCRENRLVIEIDGGQHIESATDLARTRRLNSHGYSGLRFWNQEVLAERRAVLETILVVLDGLIAAPSPGLRYAPATLSPVGRGGARQ